MGLISRGLKLIGSGIKWVVGRLIYAFSQLVKMILGFAMLIYMAIPFVAGGLIFLAITAFVAGSHAADRLGDWVTRED